MPLDRRHFFLVLIPPLVYALYYSVLIPVQTTGYVLHPDADLAGTRQPLEIQYHFLWVSTFAVFFAVSAAVAMSAMLTFWRNLSPADRRVALGLVIAGLVFTVIGEKFATGDRWYRQLGDGLFCEAFCGIENGQCAGAGQSCGLLRQLDLALDLTKYVAALALISLTLAFVSTLRGTEGTVAEQAKALARAAKEQDALLYRGAAVYVMACLSMLAWMVWPIPMLEAARAEDYRAIMLGALVLQGVGFSLGIASIFLPASLILHNRIAGLVVDGALEGKSKAAWLAEMGLDNSPVEQLRRVGAVLLPTFVSFLPALDGLWR